MKIDLYHPQELGLVLLIVAIALAVLYYALRLTVLRKRPTVTLPAKPYRTALLPFDADDEDAVPTPEILRLVLQTLRADTSPESVRNTPPPTRLLITAVLTIPRSLALDAPLPQRENEIQTLLQNLRQHAEEVTAGVNDTQPARSNNNASFAEPVEIVTVTRRARSFVEEAARYAAAEQCDLLILPQNAAASPLPLDAAQPDGTDQAPAVQLQRRIESEILFLRAPRPAQS